jgi:hypothetical protein
VIISCFIIFYFYTNKSKEIEVNDRLVTKVAAGLDLESYSIFPPQKYVSIQGEVLNKSNKPLSNLILEYLIGDDTLKVIVAYLNVGDKVLFNSKELKVNNSWPDYSLLEIIVGD